MSNAANDPISLDDLIAAVGGPSSASDSPSSSSGNSRAPKTSASSANEQAPSIDLLSALGLESLPDESSRPVFYSEREERERKREAQRREQQIRSQQWQRELREIEARKARIEAEKPVASPEVDKSVVQTVPSQSAQGGAVQPADGQPTGRAPRFEATFAEVQPIPTPGFMTEQPRQEPSAVAQAQPQGTIASMPSEPVIVPTPAEQPVESASTAAPIRQASFSSLPQRRAFITPLQPEQAQGAATAVPVEAPSSSEQQPIDAVAPEAQPTIAPEPSTPIMQAEPIGAPDAAVPAEPPVQAAPLDAAPRRASFSDYRAGQVSITPLGGVEAAAPAEEPSVLANANIQLAEERSTTILSHLITQDHSQAFIEPSEAMNAPIAPAPSQDEEPVEEPAEGVEDAGGAYEAHEGAAAESFEAEEYDYDLEEVDYEEEAASEEEGEEPYITRRSFPASDTSSFSAIEPDLRMPGEPEPVASPFGQPSGVLPPLSGNVLQNISGAAPAEEADITAETVVPQQGYGYLEEDDAISLEEPQAVPSAIFQAPVPEPAPVQGSAEPTRKPTLRQVEPSFDEGSVERGSRSRIVGIILIVVAALCALFAIVLVSGALNLGGLFGSGADDEGSGDEAPTIVYEATGADSATYSYVVRGPDGSTHEATEEAVFDEDGVLIESTISVDVDDQETADELLEQLRDEFGDSVMDYKTSDSKVIIVLDIERDDLTKEIYTELLSANMAEFKVVS